MINGDVNDYVINDGSINILMGAILVDPFNGYVINIDGLTNGPGAIYDGPGVGNNIATAR
jgi:hypothetical protein